MGQAVGKKSDRKIFLYSGDRIVAIHAKFNNVTEEGQVKKYQVCLRCVISGLLVGD